MALPYDVLFLGSFAYAGYRTLGRWLKFNDDSAKHNTGACGCGSASLAVADSQQSLVSGCGCVHVLLNDFDAQ